MLSFISSATVICLFTAGETLVKTGGGLDFTLRNLKGTAKWKKEGAPRKIPLIQGFFFKDDENPGLFLCGNIMVLWNRIPPFSELSLVFCNKDQCREQDSFMILPTSSFSSSWQRNVVTKTLEVKKKTNPNLKDTPNVFQAVAGDMHLNMFFFTLSKVW